MVFEKPSVMETYRSGHNENDSKSFCLHGHVGSNPTVSVIFIKFRGCFAAPFYYFVCPSAQRAFGPCSLVRMRTTSINS